MKYSKQPLDIPALLAMLKTRGLIIGDGQQAKRLFGVFSYFRLANYLHPMEADNETHQYKPNSSFENYRFYTALREIVLRAIRAHSGLPPVRQCSCRAYQKEKAVVLGGFFLSLKNVVIYKSFTLLLAEFCFF